MTEDPSRDYATTLLSDCVGTLKQRGNEYGGVTDDFDRIAAMWTILFGREFAGHEVAMAMVCLKLSRLVWAPGNRDSWLDAAGYSALGWACGVSEETKKARSVE